MTSSSILRQTANRYRIYLTLLALSLLIGACLSPGGDESPSNAEMFSIRLPYSHTFSGALVPVDVMLGDNPLTGDRIGDEYTCDWSDDSPYWKIEQDKVCSDNHIRFHKEVSASETVNIEVVVTKNTGGTFTAKGQIRIEPGAGKNRLIYILDASERMDELFELESNKTRLQRAIQSLSEYREVYKDDETVYGVVVAGGHEQESTVERCSEAVHLALPLNVWSADDPQHDKLIEAALEKYRVVDRETNDWAPLVPAIKLALSELTDQNQTADQGVSYRLVLLVGGGDNCISITTLEEYIFDALEGSKIETVGGCKVVLEEIFVFGVAIEDADTNNELRQLVESINNRLNSLSCEEDAGANDSGAIAELLVASPPIKSAHYINVADDNELREAVVYTQQLNSSHPAYQSLGYAGLAALAADEDFGTYAAMTAQANETPIFEHAAFTNVEFLNALSSQLSEQVAGANTGSQSDSVFVTSSFFGSYANYERSFFSSGLAWDEIAQQYAGSVGDAASNPNAFAEEIIDFIGAGNNDYLTELWQFDDAGQVNGLPLPQGVPPTP